MLSPLKSWHGYKRLCLKIITILLHGSGQREIWPSTLSGQCLRQSFQYIITLEKGAKADLATPVMIRTALFNVFFISIALATGSTPPGTYHKEQRDHNQALLGSA